MDGDSYSLLMNPDMAFFLTAAVYEYGFVKKCFEHIVTSKRQHYYGVGRYWSQNRTELHICIDTMPAQEYRNNFISNIIEPFHCTTGEKLRFLSDTATLHRANIVCNRLDDLGIRSLPLPP